VAVLSPNLEPLLSVLVVMKSFGHQSGKPSTCHFFHPGRQPHTQCYYSKLPAWENQRRLNKKF
jgi:hypothetical protein